MKQPPTSSSPAPLLSWPLKPGDPCIVSSEPARWAFQNAWDIREHDLDRWLDARYHSKIEDFWTAEFVYIRGREYCEAVLQYIVSFNHEEVGGYAVMFIDQMMMWQPHYFPYAMKHRCCVELLFEGDQIEHYGRKMLEKVVEWCKVAYDTHQSYWDNLLDNPPMGEDYDAFTAGVKKHHHPQKLKDMKIVPQDRPDDWPTTYFAKARGKSALPLHQAPDQHVASLRKPSANDEDGKHGNNGHAPGQPKDAQANAQARTQTDASKSTSTKSAATQSRSNASKRKQKSTGAPAVVGNPGGDDDCDNSDGKDKDRNYRNMKAPQSPRGKKVAQSDDKGDDMKLPNAQVHRRVKSETDRPSKSSEDTHISALQESNHACKPNQQIASIVGTEEYSITNADNDLAKKSGLSHEDWMTAPGMERRAVSSQEQSQLLEKAMQGPNNKSGRVPDIGRGGAEAAIGRYQYGLSSSVPSFAHPYTHDAVAQNNAAYLYHQDHSFGRFVPPRPDHATTYRPGSNIYRTDPQRGDMFVPITGPQPQFSYQRVPSGPYSQHQGRRHPQDTSQMVGSIYGSPLPQLNQMSHAQPLMASPQVVPTAPHGVVPNNIMEPYLRMAAQGMYPQPQPPMSRAGHQPAHPGYPAMRLPAQLVARAPGLLSFDHQQVTQGGPRPSIPGQKHAGRAGRAGGPPATSYAEPRNVRRDMVQSNPVHLSPPAARFHSHNNLSVQQKPIIPPTGPAVAYATMMDRPPHNGPARQYPRHHSRFGDTVPFPPYDDMLDPTGLPESQQCTSITIGPDAEDVVTLWFADIPSGTSTEQLAGFIEQTMPVADLKRITFDTNSSYAKGWSFVKFYSNADARAALEKFQGAPFNGGHLKVQVPERRTNNPPKRRVRTSFASFGQSSDNTDAFTGYQLSFSGASHMPTRFYDFHASPSAPRRSRGSSMSQAIHAVRRNSTFSKQDARSDLPLPQLPQVAEVSKPASPAPLEQQQSRQRVATPLDIGDEQIAAMKKPGTKAKKKPKKKPKQSRDGSAAPSESNVSSTAGGSGTPLLLPTAPRGNSTAKAQLERGHNARPLSTSPAKSITRAIGSPTKPHTQTREEFVVGAISDFEDGAVDTKAASEKAISDTTVVHKPDQASTSVAAGSDCGGSSLIETADGGVMGSKNPVEAEGEVVTEKSVAGIDRPEEAGPAEDVGYHKSEASTVIEQSKDVGLSKAKAKGPAHTESFSMFGLNKQQKKLEKQKEKKARKASRKVSKTVNLATMEVQKTQSETLESSASGAGKENWKASNKGKQKISESSSLAGTPETAREYPESLPNTPSPKISTVAICEFVVLLPCKLTC
jgi:hypothetical protein